MPCGEVLGPNLKRAERHRAAILVAIENGTFEYAKTFPDSAKRLEFLAHPTQRNTVAKFMENFLASQKAIVKASTYRDYRKIVDNVIDIIQTRCCHERLIETRQRLIVCNSSEPHSLHT